MRKQKHNKPDHQIVEEDTYGNFELEIDLDELGLPKRIKVQGEDHETSSFAGTANTSFVTRGLDPVPWMVRGGLGLVGNMTETVEVTARYDIEVREDFDNQTASVKVRWAF